jgi:putative ABC transport system permease protein
LKDGQTGNEKIIYETITPASVGFIEMFKPEILSGDVNQAFTLGNAMLTESAAKRIFGNKHPVGEIFTYDNVYWRGDEPYTVAAVCADFPDNCSLKNGIFLFQPDTENRPLGFTTYFEIEPSDKNSLLKKMNEEQYITKSVGKGDEIWQFELTALPDIHLHFPEKGEGNPVIVILLLTVGITLLVVSYFNFLNFFIAMAPIRARNINLRRILGESSFRLKLSVIIETVFLSFISFLLSILIIQFLDMGILKDFFKTDLTIAENPYLLLFVGVVSILLGFLVGIYPAVYTTSFTPTTVLNGSFSLSSRNQWIKNISIGMQFIVAIFLIVSMLFVKIQYNYMRNKDWGIQTENVFYLNTGSNMNEVKNFMAELKQNPHIVDVTTAFYHPGQEKSWGWAQSWGREFEGKSINLNIWPVESHFFDFFGVNIVTGERFKENDDKKMIINRAFSKEYGFDNMEGKEIDDYEVIGIVEDFNYRSLYSNIQPLAFISIPKEYEQYYYNWVFVKTIGANTRQTAEYVSNTWKTFSGEPFEVLSLTDTIQAMYQKEKNFLDIVSICGIIAIIVAIIGLYGFVFFDTKAKRKNIAIRKVHGATIANVMLMLNKQNFIRFAFSCLVAFPLSYYAVQRWLENFAYKTPLYWWVFVLGGLIVLVISLLTISWETYKAANGNPVEVVKN